MIKKASMLIGVGAALCMCFWAYIFLLRPRLEVIHNKQLMQNMATLRDRVRLNAGDLDALDSLIRSLRSPDSFERVYAACYIGEVGSNAQPAVNALTDILRGSDRTCAREAARSLGEIGPSARRAVPALLEELDKYPAGTDIGWFAAASLGMIADPDDASVLKALQEAAKSPDELMRMNATEGLRDLDARRTKAN